MTEATITVEDLASTSPDKTLKIVHIAGQLDESNIDEKIQEIYKLVEATPKNLSLLIDMERLEYMNSKLTEHTSKIRIIIFMYKTVKFLEKISTPRI